MFGFGAVWAGRRVASSLLCWIGLDVVRKPFLMAFLVGTVAFAAQTYAQSGRGQGGRDDDPARSAAPPNARTIVVPSNVAWTNTRINVTRGQHLRFEPSGEIRLSFNGEDIARASGPTKARHTDSAPIPSTPVGALIGRVGNGRPFSIGDTTTALDMPANGRLFLGVNDDHVADNSGNLVVKIWEP